VAAATGLSTDDRQLDDLADFWSRVDELYWNKGDPPKISGTKFACGSRCAVDIVMFEEAKQIYGSGLMICRFRDIEAVAEGTKSKSDLNHYGNGVQKCENVAFFLEEHRGDIDRLKDRLRRFPRALRTEMILWSIGRDQCGYALCGADGKRIATDKSDAVNAAHCEYGEMMYPKRWRMCPIHGVLYEDD